MKSRFFLGSSLEPLAGVPFVAAHGAADDHLRIIVLLATSLGQPEDQDVRTCIAPDSPWADRLDAFQDLLQRVQGKRPTRPFAGLVHPDAFPIALRGDELWEDATFQQERWELFTRLMQSFERGGWLLLRPEPREETTDALHGSGCVAEPPAPVAGASEDEEVLARVMLGMDVSPATQALVRGLVKTGSLRARSAVRRLEAAPREQAEAVAFEAAYDALSAPAVEAAHRLSLLRGPQALNGVAGPFLLHEGALDDLRLSRAAVEELIDRGWLGLGTDPAGHRCFAMAEQLRALLYERAVMADRKGVEERHRRLAERGGAAVAEKVEAHYHAIESGDERLAIDTAAFYGSDLRRLARPLSEQGSRGELEKLLRAAEIYGAVVDRFDRTDAYAWEYRGYNLALYYSKKRLPYPPGVEDQIRLYYRRACEHDEDNPLYWGRQLGFRARLGEEVGAEFRQRMLHFMQLSSRQGIRFATPVLQALEPERRKALAAPWVAVLKSDGVLAGLLS